MQAIDLTLDAPADNLALDEALLLVAQESGRAAECLRFWEAPQPLVVVGRSSRVDDELDRLACQDAGVPILRRASGGAAIVAGPGCLMYALVLSLESRPQLRDLDECHRAVLGTMAAALRPLAGAVEHRGICDLVWNGRKFSGNSLRVKRTHLVYHGTLLYDFDLALIARLLRTAPRQPDYRQGRDHADFVTNVPLRRGQLVEAVRAAWHAEEAGQFETPFARVRQLTAEKYGRDEWTFSL